MLRTVGLMGQLQKRGNERARNRRIDLPIKDELYSYILQRLAFLIKVPWLPRELRLGYIKLI